MSDDYFCRLTKEENERAHKISLSVIWHIRSLNEEEDPTVVLESIRRVFLCICEATVSQHNFKIYCDNMVRSFKRHEKDGC